MTDFIGIYDNVLSAKDCDVLINQFEKGPHQEGGFYEKEQYNINHSYKKSIELKDSRFTKTNHWKLPKLHGIKLGNLSCLNLFSLILSSLVNAYYFGTLTTQRNPPASNR